MAFTNKITDIRMIYLAVLLQGVNIFNYMDHKGMQLAHQHSNL